MSSFSFISLLVPKEKQILLRWGTDFPLLAYGCTDFVLNSNDYHSQYLNSANYVPSTAPGLYNINPSNPPNNTRRQVLLLPPV